MTQMGAEMAQTAFFLLSSNIYINKYMFKLWQIHVTSLPIHAITKRNDTVGSIKREVLFPFEHSIFISVATTYVNFKFFKKR